jgi:prepilin-type N-terminal cleavage/methylation domain-containing protein
MSGFTLMELLVAAAVFLVITSTAFSLFNQHLKLATRQENLSAVNIGMRNAMAQLEMDLAAGGQNMLGTVQGAAPVFGLGVNITNNMPGTAATCKLNADLSYPIPSACFDALTIPAVKPCAAAGGTTAPVLVTTTSDNLSTSNSIVSTDNNPGANMANDASCFQTGDEILVLSTNGGVSNMTCDGVNSFYYCVAFVTLTANATSAGTTITLTHNLTAANGQASGCPGAACTDPLGLMGTTGFQKAQSSTFTNGAYLVDLGSAANTVTYSVQPNPTNAADPQLMRCTAGVCSAVVDQVIGFKIGAALWDNKLSTGTDIANYFYNAANYCNGASADCSVSPPPANDPYDYSLVRAVRISMVARTTPHTDQSLYTFQNGFDAGPYLVQQSAVVVDLRNMSNNEFGN